MGDGKDFEAAIIIPLSALEGNDTNIFDKTHIAVCSASKGSSAQISGQSVRAGILNSPL